MQCISAAYVGMRCLSACLSVTFVNCAKMNKDIFEIFLPSCSQAILVFRCQTRWRYSDGNPFNGGVECRWGRQKRDSERISGFALHTGLQCCQPYESRSVKNKAATEGGERRAHRGVRRPLFAQDDDEVFVTGSMLYAGDEGRSNPPDTTPLVITPFSAVVGHRIGQNPAGIFVEN